MMAEYSFYLLKLTGGSQHTFLYPNSPYAYALFTRLPIGLTATGRLATSFSLIR
jgi:hypothetical protein